MVPPEDRGGFAAHKLIDAVEGLDRAAFPRGLAREYRLFDELVRSAPSAALRHVFFAERELGEDSRRCAERHAADDQERRRRRSRHDGHAASRSRSRSAGIPVVIVDRARRGRGSRRARRSWACSCTKCRRAGSRRKKRGSAASRFASARIATELADADVIVEAVFENIDVKNEVFRKLDASPSRARF